MFVSKALEILIIGRTLPFCHTQKNLEFCPFYYQKPRFHNVWEIRNFFDASLYITTAMAIGVVEFSREGYKIRKDFA